MRDDKAESTYDMKRPFPCHVELKFVGGLKLTIEYYVSDEERSEGRVVVQGYSATGSKIAVIYDPEESMHGWIMYGGFASASSAASVHYGLRGQPTRRLGLPPDPQQLPKFNLQKVVERLLLPSPSSPSPSLSSLLIFAVKSTHAKLIRSCSEQYQRRLSLSRVRP